MVHNNRNVAWFQHFPNNDGFYAKLFACCRAVEVAVRRAVRNDSLTVFARAVLTILSILVLSLAATRAIKSFGTLPVGNWDYLLDVLSFETVYASIVLATVTFSPGKLDVTSLLGKGAVLFAIIALSAHVWPQIVFLLAGIAKALVDVFVAMFGWVKSAMDVVKDFADFLVHGWIEAFIDVVKAFFDTVLGWVESLIDAGKASIDVLIHPNNVNEVKEFVDYIANFTGTAFFFVTAFSIVCGFKFYQGTFGAGQYAE